MKGSENPYPSVNMEEIASDGSTLSNATADYRRLFLGEDGSLHLKDSAGTVTAVGGGGGDVATDAIWDAAGDLAVGSGADTAAKLGIGAAGGALSVINSAVAWNSGTSFPANKATGDRYWRTDLGLEFYWDGTRWLSTLVEKIIFTGFTNPVTGDGDQGSAVVPQGVDIFVTTFYAVTYVATTNSGSAYWTAQLRKDGASGIGTALSTISNSPDAMTMETIAPAEVVTGAKYLTVLFTKVSTPGNIYTGGGSMYVAEYRRIAT